MPCNQCQSLTVDWRWIPRQEHGVSAVKHQTTCTEAERALPVSAGSHCAMAGFVAELCCKKPRLFRIRDRHAELAPNSVVVVGLEHADSNVRGASTDNA